MTWLLPKHTRDAWRGIDSVQQVQNLQLQLFTYVREPDKKADAEMRAKHFRDIAETGVPKVLAKLGERRREFLRSVGAAHLPMVLTDDYTCGLSHGSVLENAMTVLPPWGIPVVTAEGQKGILKRWLACLLAQDLHVKDDRGHSLLKQARMMSLFDADGEKASNRIQFFDAWPAYDSSFRLRVTGTTVHHQSWYGDTVGSSGAVPDGIENPTPIPFLAVRRGTVYDVGYIVGDDAWDPTQIDETMRKSLADFDITEHALQSRATFVRALFVSAARYDGFGARTNVGHGRMEEVLRQSAPV